MIQKQNTVFNVNFEVNVENFQKYCFSISKMSKPNKLLGKTQIVGFYFDLFQIDVEYSV